MIIFLVLLLFYLWLQSIRAVICDIVVGSELSVLSRGVRKGFEACMGYIFNHQHPT